ncbi:biopolymer transport protein ExbB [Pectinatus haikarae]|uniref:Biopolymer transport protein ExbB n=2 Tax=Pectinatus haikarae TaxID=349096 RepID=A0ABT9Y8E6_9FIRM|nr:biopolymer transport protein ExbB [Pectinatus haikarae]
MSSVEFFSKGGPVMYALLLCSLCVAAIAIDRFIFYRRAQKGIMVFLQSLPEITKKPLEDAMEVCERETNAAGFIAVSGLKAAEDNTDVKLALDTAYASAAMQLRAKLNYLSMIVTLSPLLGLLGTIAGMIQSFNIFSLQAGQPLAITGGIGEALIATATGLCVAIFALLIHTYFAQQLDKILNDLDRAASIVLSSVCKGNEGAVDAT